ncbi:MAG: hypothetical protein U5K33_00175 [Halofilum sp. (in: g-proteobacteria)]|nr:hypothetical protein [Halofilum sp. (in: g-proteobacteria)]
MAAGDGAPRSLSRRLLWFVGLWLGGVAAVAGLAYLIRWFIA